MISRATGASGSRPWHRCIHLLRHLQQRRHRAALGRPSRQHPHRRHRRPAAPCARRHVPLRHRLVVAAQIARPHPAAHRRRRRAGTACRPGGRPACRPGRGARRGEHRAGGATGRLTHRGIRNRWPVPGSWPAPVRRDGGCGGSRREKHPGRADQHRRPGENPSHRGPATERQPSGARHATARPHPETAGNAGRSQSSDGNCSMTHPALPRSNAAPMPWTGKRKDTRPRKDMDQPHLGAPDEGISTARAVAQLDGRAFTPGCRQSPIKISI
jgi:hypothetical protein